MRQTSELALLQATSYILLLYIGSATKGRFVKECRREEEEISTHVRLEIGKIGKAVLCYCKNIVRGQISVISSENSPWMHLHISLH